jgi:hypothetical protein
VGDKEKDTDLPQPGLDELEGNGDEERSDPTEGPGNVSVDEPTEPALRRGDDDSWSDVPDDQSADPEDDTDADDTDAE